MCARNTPVQTARHPFMGCRAALHQQQQLAQLREQWVRRGLPPLYVSVLNNSKQTTMVKTTNNTRYYR
jgi:hypothetical protein